MTEEDGLLLGSVHKEAGIWTYFYFMGVSACLHVCMCITCMAGVHGGQKRDPGPLELDLEVVMSCHVGFGSLQEQQGS